MEDGVLKFDTTLDTSGFDKKSVRLKQDLMQLVQTINSLGDNTQAAFDKGIPKAEQLADMLENMSMDENMNINEDVFKQYMADIKEQVGALVKQTTKAGEQIGKGLVKESDIEKSAQGLKKLTDSASLLAQQMQQFSEINVISPKMQEYTQKIFEDLQRISELRKQMAENSDDEFYNKVGKPKDEQEIADLKAEVDQLRDAQEQLEEAGGVYAGKASQEFQQLAASLQIITKSVQELRQALGIATPDFEPVEEQAEAVDDEVEEAGEDAEDTAEALEDEKNAADAAADAIDKIADASNNAADAQDDAGDSAKNTAMAMQTAAQQAAQTGQQVNNMGQQASNAAGPNGTGKAKKEVNGLSEALKRVGQAVARTGLNMLRSMADGVASAVNRLRSALAGLSKIAGSIAVGSFRALGKAVQGAGRMFTGFNKESGKSGVGVKDLIAPLLKLVTVLRLSRRAITAAMKGFSESFESLQKHSLSLKNTINTLQGSLRALSGNMAVTAGNIVELVGPAITQLINWISTLITYVNGFIALLTGKKTIAVAVNNTEGLGKAAGGSAKKMEELKRQVYGFDQLNKRTAQNDNSGGGGGGGASGAKYLEKSLEQVLPEKLLNYFKAIKEAIDKEHWEELGGLIADGINYVVGRVDEAILQIHDKAVKWSTNLARVLNGLVDRLDFTLIGKSLADGINLAIDILDAFITTFNWQNLGEGIAKGLNSLIDIIDWDHLGQTLANLFNGVLLFLNGVITNFDFIGLGTSLATGLESLLSQVDFTLLGNTIAAFVNGIVDTFRAFAEGTHWGEIGDRLGAAIIALFTGVDWDDAGNTVGLWVNGIAETLSSLVENEEMWTAIQEGISQFMESLFTPETIENVIATAGEFVERVFLELGELGSNVPWNEIAQGVADGLNDIFDVKKLTDIANAWSETINGAFNGAKKFIEEFDWKNAVDATTTAINTFLDGVEWDTVAEVLSGGFSKLLGSATQGMKDITDKFPGYATEIKDGLKKVFSSENSYIDWAELGRNFGEAVKNIFRGLATFLDDPELWSNVGRDIGTALANIDWIGIAKSMWDLFKAALGSVFNVFGGIKDAILGSLEGGEAQMEVSQIYDTLAFYGAQTGNAFSASFAEELTTVGADNVAMALTLFANGVDQETIRALDLTKLDENIYNYMDSSGKTINEVAEELSQNAGEAIGRIVPEAMAESLEAGKAEVQAKADEYGNIAANVDSQAEIKQSAQDTGESAITGAAEGLSDTKSVTEKAEAVVDDIKSPFEGLPEETKAQAEVMMQAVKASIEEGTPAAEEASKAAAQAIIDEAKGLLTEESGQDIANAFINGLNGVIVGRTAEVQGNAFTASVNAKTAFETHLNRDNGNTIGNAIMDGIEAGINNGSSKIQEAARRAAQSAYRAAKNQLGIHSPSTAFAELGMYSMLGMAEGIEDNADQAVKAVSDAMTSVADEAGSGIQFQFDKSFDKIDILVDKFSLLATTFERVADMVARIGELPIPDIAQGTVIPFRTQLADTSANEITSTQLVKAQSDQTEVLEDQRDLIRELIGVVRSLNLTLDGDKVTKSVTSRQRAMERDYAGAVI